MKIGILTFHFALNYGAVFQSFALKTALERKGYNVGVIDYRPQNMRASWDFEYYTQSVKPKWPKGNIIRKIAIYTFILFRYYKFVLYEKHILQKKYDVFSDFVKKYLLTPSANDVFFDVIVCGSDQIWNPEITGGFDNCYFGFYGDNPCVKAISYSASIGSVEILHKKNIKEEFLRLVDNLTFLSVRERNLQEFLQANGKNAYLTVDPTFLLRKEDYLPLIKKARLPKCEYIFVYALMENKYMISYAKRVAMEKGLGMVCVGGSQKIRNNELNDLTPCDFLSLLIHSKFVVTNSFHGTALSLIFNKQLSVFLPNVRQDRVVGLLREMNIESVIINNNNIRFPSVDYNEVNKIIEQKRLQAMDYLTMALNSL